MVEENQSAQNAHAPQDGHNNVEQGDLRTVFVAGAWAFISLLLIAIFAPHMTERLKFFVTTLWVIVTAFAVIAQAVIYRKQWKIMETQVQIARISEQAYMGVKRVWLEPLEIGKHPTIKIKFLNGGRTPAWNVRIPTVIAIEPTPPANPTLQESDAPHFLPAGTNQTAQFIFPVLANQNMLDDISNGIVKVFIRGEVWFDDCWGRQQSFQFFFMYRPRDQAFQTYNQETEPANPN